MTEISWRSYHLYRAEPWEEFLVDVVRPFVDGLIAESLIDSFFFVRYWERGPHIRLRMRTGAGDEVDKRLSSYFREFFERSSSTRAVAESEWFPNDSVQVIDYEPEIARYGGLIRLPIAERQFEASSRAVLSIIAQSPWSYERVLGAAIQLHLIFAHSFAFDLGAVRRYFATTAAALLRFGNPFVRLGQHFDTAERAFASAYKPRQDNFIRVHSVMWAALEDGDEFEQAWANHWRKDMRGIASRLRAVPNDGGMRLNVDEESILRSYMHMTNNRLGVRNADEAYLAYIMKRSLEQIDVLVR